MTFHLVEYVIDLFIEFLFFFFIVLDNNDQLLEEPWIVEKAIERVERLQSNSELNLNDNTKRRNESLFMCT